MAIKNLLLTLNCLMLVTGSALAQKESPSEPASKGIQQIRTEASGTATDANGNKYIWLYNDLADLDTPNPDADVPIATGSGPVIFQLVPVTTDGTGYSVTQYLKIDTPTPLDAPLTPVATTAPLSCQPL